MLLIKERKLVQQQKFGKIEGCTTTLTKRKRGEMQKSEQNAEEKNERDNDDSVLDGLTFNPAKKIELSQCLPSSTSNHQPS